MQLRTNEDTRHDDVTLVISPDEYGLILFALRYTADTALALENRSDAYVLHKELYELSDGTEND